MLKIILTFDSLELRTAIANFEAVHGAIEQACPGLIVQLVNYCNRTLHDPDAFYLVSREVPDMTASILQCIGEDDIPQWLQTEYEAFELKYGSIMFEDVTWLLIEEVVRAVVEADGDTIGFLGKGAVKLIGT